MKGTLSSHGGFAALTSTRTYSPMPTASCSALLLTIGSIGLGGLAELSVPPEVLTLFV